MEFKEIKQAVNMADVLSAYGIEFDGKSCACALHGGDNKKAFSVFDKNQAWKCFTGDCGSGDIFSFVEKYENISPIEAKERIMEMFNLSANEPAKSKPKKKKATSSKVEVNRVAHIYNDIDGVEIYRTNRIEYSDGSKSFLPEYKGKNGLPESIRTLYNLDKIHHATDEKIFICEGEKSADAITSLGGIGTTNPSGSNSWNESYAELLRDKIVILMPDADEAGQKFKSVVEGTLQGVVRELRIINMPQEFILDNPDFKGHDIADYLSVHGKKATKTFLRDAIDMAEVLPNGVAIDRLGRPRDGFKRIKERIKSGEVFEVFNLNQWLPSMNISINKSDLLVLMANTGTGKTRILHNLPFCVKDKNFAIFDLELSLDMLCLRYGAWQNGLSVSGIQRRISAGYEVEDPNVDNVYIQKHDKLTVKMIKEQVDILERVTGKRMDIVCVDYIGLMGGTGGAYQATSDNVEAFKSYITGENRVGILTTQVSRNIDKEEGLYRCPSIFSAKNSGSIENSSQTLIGFWKDSQYSNGMKARVLKHTHGEIPEHDINLDVADMRITESTYSPERDENLGL